MFNKLFTKSTNTTNTEVNAKKDFKKLASLIMLAKGTHRTINNFGADCKIDGGYIELIIREKINAYPNVQTLNVFADNSQGRVSLQDLKLACGYSLYANNDLEQIKNIRVRRGDFCFADFGDKGIDSEVGGPRMVLVVQNNKGNACSSNTIVIAMTTRSKVRMPTHVFASSKECGIPQDSIICCELPNTISKRRLIGKNGVFQKVSECPMNIMLSVEIALMKSEGIIELHVSEAEAIETLRNLNKVKPIRQNIQENSYMPTQSYQQQVSYA